MSGLPARLIILWAMALVPWGWSGAEQQHHMSDDGYRESRFRAELPAAHPEAATLDTEALQQLMETRRPVLIDVMPMMILERPELHAGLPPGTPRVSLPGAVWLPNVGLPALDEELNRYFCGHLQALTGGDRDRPVVFFCISDCWMAWNAARRASRYGHRAVYWYRDGTDAWADDGRPTELVKAEGEGRAPCAELPNGC